MRLALGLTALAAVIAGLWFAFWRDTRHEGEQLVEAAHEALLARDAGALLALASPREVEALGLTEPILQRFLDEYVLVDFEDMRVAQADVVEDRPDAVDVHTLVRTYVTPGGRYARFAFFSRARADGASIDSLVWSLFFGRMLESMARESLTGRQVVLLWAETMERDAEMLNDLGLKGIYFVKPDGEEFMTWKDFAKTRREAVAKADAAEKAATGAKK